MVALRVEYFIELDQEIPDYISVCNNDEIRKYRVDKFLTKHQRTREIYCALKKLNITPPTNLSEKNLEKLVRYKGIINCKINLKHVYVYKSE